MHLYRYRTSFSPPSPPLRRIEPLLQRIKDEPQTLVCPVVDNIRDRDLAYQAAERVAGGFAWSGHFAWIEAGGADGRVPKDKAAPVRSDGVK